MRIPYMAVAVMMLGMLVMTPAAIAESNPPNPQVAAKLDDQLARFESKVIDLERQASDLEALTRSKVGWQTHSHHLGAVRQTFNELGMMLVKMEAHADQGTEMQRKAIAEARPHLVEIDDSLESALSSLNETRRAIATPDYQNNLKAVHDHARELYRTVDAITDYRAAKLRLQGLSEVPSGN